MTSKEIYDLGYAIPGYDIKAEVRHWRWEDETYTLLWNAVQLLSVDGIPFWVARIEDVRNCALQRM